MIFSTKELVRLALCYIILMVSLSKCEIDSSSSIITTTPVPEKVQPPPLPEGDQEAREKALSGTSLNRAYYSISSSEETVKTSSSYSPSSSSLEEEVPVSFNNTNEHWQQEQQQRGQQQQANVSFNNTNTINGTIPPKMVSPMLTLPVINASQREAGDSNGKELAHEKHSQPQQQNRLVIVHENRDSNSNNEGEIRSVAEKGERISSPFGASKSFNYNNINAKYQENMGDGIRSYFPTKMTNVREETNPAPGTVIGQSLDSLAVLSRPLSSLTLPRRQAMVLPGFVANKDRFISSFSARENYESRDGTEDEEKDSLIPTHTWIPTGLTFSCKNRVPGYYADASSISKCQVYHMCMTDGRKYTLLCGIGTVFNQLTFVCDHWYNYKCAEAESDYKINRMLWEGFVGDDETDKDEDEFGDNNQNGEAEIENDAIRVRQSVAFRSPFAITSKISRTLDSLS